MARGSSGHVSRMSAAALLIYLLATCFLAACVHAASTEEETDHSSGDSWGQEDSSHSTHEEDAHAILSSSDHDAETAATCQQNCASNLFLFNPELFQVCVGGVTYPSSCIAACLHAPGVMTPGACHETAHDDDHGDSAHDDDHGEAAAHGDEHGDDHGDGDGDDHGDGHGGAHAHPHFALTYLFFMLCVGALCFQYEAELRLPYTVVLLVVGGLIGVIHESTDRGLGSLSVSIQMWTNMDPHLLLFAFLPALLFGDAINLEWHMMKKCFPQMLLLAGPGVALGSFMCALLPKYVFGYGWDWNHSMLMGSMLAATDPVAVVGLLKELGASPKLSMIIAGESMMNDGTAVVFYLLFYKLCLGATYTGWEIAEFFSQMALGGPAIGIAIATVGFFWIAAGGNCIIEITVFFATAYFGFITAEQEGGASGVLGVVFAGVVMATYAWPYVDDLHAMHNVWHWVEWTGNTLIFLLAGTILGATFVTASSITVKDWGFLLLNWVAVNVARFTLVGLFFPLLRRLGYGLSWQEAVFMGWGGLRGAVGLALAIAVAHTEQFHGADGERYLFHIGGIAALTLLINGTTGAWLLTRLGLLDKTPSQLRALSEARHKVQHSVEDKYAHLCEKRMFQQHNKQLMQTVVSRIKKHIHDIEDADQSLVAAKEAVHAAVEDNKVHPANESNADMAMVACMRTVYLKTVRSQYWDMLHHGELPQEKANILLNINQAAVDDAHQRLSEWDMLVEAMGPNAILRTLAALSGMKLTVASEDQQIVVLVFIEAHEKAAQIVYDTFGADEGVDSPEEAVLEKEVNEMLASAEDYLKDSVNLTVKQANEETTNMMIMLLKKEVQHEVNELARRGLISPKDGETIKEDMDKALGDTAAAENQLARRLNRSLSTVRKSIFSGSQEQLSENWGGLLDALGDQSGAMKKAMEHGEELNKSKMRSMMNKLKAGEKPDDPADGEASKGGDSGAAASKGGDSWNKMEGGSLNAPESSLEFQSSPAPLTLERMSAVDEPKSAPQPPNTAQPAGLPEAPPVPVNVFLAGTKSSSKEVKADVASEAALPQGRVSGEEPRRSLDRPRPGAYVNRRTSSDRARTSSDHRRQANFDKHC